MLAVGLYLLALVFFGFSSLVGIFHLRKYAMAGDLSTVALGVYLLGSFVLLAVSFVLIFLR